MHNHFTIGDTSSWAARLLESTVILMLLFGSAVAAYHWICVGGAPNDPEDTLTDSPEEQDPPEDEGSSSEGDPLQDTWARVWETGLFLITFGGLLYDKGALLARVAQTVCKAGKLL